MTIVAKCKAAEQLEFNREWAKEKGSKNLPRVSTSLKAWKQLASAKRPDFNVIRLWSHLSPRMLITTTEQLVEADSWVWQQRQTSQKLSRDIKQRNNKESRAKTALMVKKTMHMSKIASSKRQHHRLHTVGKIDFTELLQASHKTNTQVNSNNSYGWGIHMQLL